MNKRFIACTVFAVALLLFVLVGSVMVYGADSPTDTGQDKNSLQEQNGGNKMLEKEDALGTKRSKKPNSPEDDGVGTPGSSSKAANDNIPGVQIPGSAVIGGNLNSYSNEDDVYRLWLNAGQTIVVSMTGPAGSDFDVYFFNSLATSVTSTTGLVSGSASYTHYPEEFTYTVPAGAGGYYYLDVYAYSGAGNYIFSWSVNASPDDNIPGIRLPGTSPIGGSLNQNTDHRDVYYVYLSDGQTFNASMTGIGSNDFDMILFKWGSTNAESDTGVAGSGSLSYPDNMSYTVPPGGGGYYFLDIYTSPPPEADPPYTTWGSGNYIFGYSIVNHNPIGSVDGISSVGPNLINVRGWTLDPDSISSIPVHFYADGVPLGTTTANLVRGDIGAVFPGYGANHGYSANLSLGPGPHNVCAYGINTGTGGNAGLGCRVINVAVNPVGNLDWASRAGIWGTASGWAIDPDTAAAVAIHLYSDGRLIGPQPADLYANRTRGDIGARFPAYGANHGFYVYGGMSSLPHNLCVYAINQGPGVNTLIGCRVI
ncbi:MAG: hypothetical protein ACYC6O_05245 [Thermoleophilia bacterium]